MKTTTRFALPEESRPPPFRCVVGETLCHVYVLSQAQFDALPGPRRRHVKAEHVPGLGWVVASPVRLG